MYWHATNEIRAAYGPARQIRGSVRGLHGSSCGPSHVLSRRRPMHPCALLACFDIPCRLDFFHVFLSGGWGTCTTNTIYVSRNTYSDGLRSDRSTPTWYGCFCNTSCCKTCNPPIDRLGQGENHSVSSRGLPTQLYRTPNTVRQKQRRGPLRCRRCTLGWIHFTPFLLEVTSSLHYRSNMRTLGAPCAEETARCFVRTPVV